MQHHTNAIIQCHSREGGNLPTPPGFRLDGRNDIIVGDYVLVLGKPITNDEFIGNSESQVADLKQISPHHICGI